MDRNELLQLLDGLRNDIKADMKQVVTEELRKLNITGSLNEQNKRIEELEKKNNDLKKIVLEQQRIIDRIGRDNNLTFYGVN
jgi:uncharacterized protein YydD (DUF2326 family)